MPITIDSIYLDNDSGYRFGRIDPLGNCYLDDYDGCE